MPEAKGESVFSKLPHVAVCASSVKGHFVRFDFRRFMPLEPSVISAALLTGC
jgi:hypothetical protein